VTAEALIERIKGRGGRVFCMPSQMVFCLTTDPELRDGLLKLGATFNSGVGLPGERGYRRTRDATTLEWDIWIHPIKVDGETTIYEAAGGKNP
jgi:hypothetical protein